jgi:hypothetical protein
MLTNERENVAAYLSEVMQCCKWVFNVYEYQTAIPSFLFAESLLATNSYNVSFSDEYVKFESEYVPETVEVF